MKRTLLQTIAIIAISGLLGVAANVFRADGIPLVENWQKKVLNEELAGGLPAVSLKEAAEVFNSGEALFVDARDPDFFEMGHIPGAINLPLNDFESVFPDLEEQLQTAFMIITYCDGASCEMSVELTERLLMMGLEQVMVYTGGMHQWETSGKPVEEGQ
jgi:rhodanese-related sulfurtransferase